MQERCPVGYYNLYGVSIHIESNDLHFSSLVETRFKNFLASPMKAADLVFRIHHGTGRHVLDCAPRDARPVYQALDGSVLYDDASRMLHINFRDAIRVSVRADEGQTAASVTDNDPAYLQLMAQPIMTMSLKELLKRRGLFSIHAGGLCMNDRGLLLAGESGAGKSTLTTALLLRGGFRFLGDDTLFLTQGDEGLKVLAFPDDIDLTDGAIALLPPLEFLLERPRFAGCLKRSVPVEELPNMQIALSCRPAVTLFPRIVDREDATLQCISKSEAFRRLAPNVLLTDRESTQAHLDMLGRLVRETECFVLEAGRNIDLSVDLVNSLMTQGARSCHPVV